MDCIFCKIISGQLDTAKIWSNNEFTAILDINPNVIGQTLLVSNTHFSSNLQDMPDETYTLFLLAARKVQKLLKKSLGKQHSAELH